MATATAHRPWEVPSASPAPAPTSTPTMKNQLPPISALTNPGENFPSGQSSPASTRERSSGAWSSQPQSTRSSAYSSVATGYQMRSSFNSNHTSPNRASNSSQLGAQPFDAFPNPPTSASMVGSPGFASNPHAPLPFLNQNHDPSRFPQTQNLQHQTQTQPKEEFPTESRRSSLGSQVHQGFNSLHINSGGSPYPGSVNHSQTSLAQNLSRERGISQSAGAIRNSRSSGQYPQTPLSPTSEPRPTNFAPRIAPPIGRNPRSDIYTADEPTPGQAYAFPDPPTVQPGDLPPTPGQRLVHDDVRTGVFARRDSGHTSITSSIATHDSRLPAGQRRLDESGDMPGTHHHSLQQNQSANLSSDPEMSTDGTTPYSRTPALRVSHKMAERKRRSEMKDLFENLRSQIPSHQGSKSSKWEILTKASEYIKTLENSVHNYSAADKQLQLFSRELENSRRDNDSLRNENQRLLHEMQRIQASMQQIQQGQQPQPTPMYTPQPPYSSPVNHINSDPSRSLPPLTNGASVSSSMQGVQYTS
ncbi:MAG: hypothetical protein MMC33_002304 [Icmadophila ericetorum]|nr:hypothetical protein [Icmadophila ericetorum]